MDEYLVTEQKFTHFVSKGALAKALLVKDLHHRVILSDNSFKVSSVSPELQL